MDTIFELATALRRVADLLEKAPAAIDARVPKPPVGPQLRRLLDYPSASAYLGCSKRTIERLASEGEFLKVPIGHRVFFDQGDLNAYIDRLKQSL